MLITIILTSLAVVIVVAMLLTYNSFVQHRNKVKEAFSTMDVYLKKRYDLIPSLVEVVKGYAAHEAETLKHVAQGRGGVREGDLGGAIDGEVKIGDALHHLLAVVEAYPDLKANHSFLDLQSQLSKMEEEIAFSRRYYNGSVRAYNNLCQMFPSNLVAGLFGFKRMPMYAVESEQERKAVNVNL